MGAQKAGQDNELLPASMAGKSHGAWLIQAQRTTTCCKYEDKDFFLFDKRGPLK